MLIDGGFAVFRHVELFDAYTVQVVRYCQNTPSNSRTTSFLCIHREMRTVPC